MITVFYGMCGTFKYTTMTSKKYQDSYPVYSQIKPFNNLLKDVFKNNLDWSDLNFAALRLIRLKDLCLVDKQDIVIERGITDYLQCYRQRGFSIDPEIQENIIQEETKILESLNKGPLRKILLVMNDPEFIENTILLDPHRRKTYPELNYYLEAQSEYTEYTKTYNNISEIININNAKSYLNSL